MTTALSEFDELVAQMVAMKIPREKAEAAARAELGLPSLLQEIRDEADARTLEKAEQHECWRIYRAHNCHVYSTSQARAARVSEGIPDFIVFWPKVGAFWFHEVKRPVGGKQTPAQKDFQGLCATCGPRYVLGDRTAAWAILRELGGEAAP